MGKPLEPRPWRAGWNHGGLFLFEFVKYEREIQEAGVVREKGILTRIRSGSNQDASNSPFLPNFSWKLTNCCLHLLALGCERATALEIRQQSPL